MCGHGERHFSSALTIEHIVFMNLKPPNFPATPAIYNQIRKAQLRCADISNITKPVLFNAMGKVKTNHNYQKDHWKNKWVWWLRGYEAEVKWVRPR